MQKQIVIHPILFILYPVLFLFARNLNFFDPEVVAGPALVSLVAGLACWAVGTHLTGDKKAAGIWVSLGFLALGSFGALHETAIRLAHEPSLEALSPATAIVAGSALVGLLVMVVLFRLRGYVDQLTYIMNVVGSVLVVVPIVNIVAAEYVAFRIAGAMPPAASAVWSAEPASAAPAAGGAERPDIYYIVLDGYGRADVLQEMFGSDSGELTGALEQSGFVVTPQSQSNYPLTLLSLTSTLNFSYLDEMMAEAAAGSPDRRFLRRLLQENRFTSFLRLQGYSIVAFASEYYEIDFKHADVSLREWWFANPFHLAVADMTPLPWVTQALGYPAQYELHRQRIRYTLENLPEAARLPGPKFVFAHVLSPHPPFVFKANGDAVDPGHRYTLQDGDLFLYIPGATRQEYVDGYREQSTFIGRKVVEAVRRILAESERPPIIVVQGDHGPGSRLNVMSAEKTDLRERFSILNAYHLPGRGAGALYDSISPVNSFRVVLNEYFGQNLPLLPDKSFFTTWSRPNDFIAVDPAAGNAEVAGAGAPQP